MRAAGRASQPRRLKRQWGCERRTGAGPVVAASPSRGALSSARVALFLTLAAWLAHTIEQVRRYVIAPVSLRSTIEALVYLALVTLLTGSASAYLIARLGYLKRARDHRRVPRTVIDRAFDGVPPSMTVIVPSYQEERRVVRQTLLSTALQEYPDMDVVLLIDDPPHPSGPAQAELLAGARALPGQIAQMLAEPAAWSRAALADFDQVAPAGPVPAADLRRLAGVYDRAEGWLRAQAEGESVEDHVDAFLADEVLGALADDLGATAAALRAAADTEAHISTARVRQLYRRLVNIFTVRLSSFERKRYASLSHEPNKAMNLNSYIGLMGGRYIERHSSAGTIVLPVAGPECDFEVRRPDYVLTLDADSMLLPEYCLRLVAHMERPDNADLAVAQTPYSSYRGAPTRLERLAGATTDLQYIAHQGMAHYGAAFWVGANAVLRMDALDQVCREETHNGFTIRSYISDRTVIEDTESTLDLRLAGWRLENYPERLSYSATPPDFGSLAVQRQRWANGGLVVLPRLWRLVRARLRGATGGPRPRRRLVLLEGFLRLNYLASIAWASLGLWVLLFYPFDQQLLSTYAVLTALPYFAALSTDLHRAGYRRTDVFRLYGLNIMLLAVNSLGVVKSIGQAIGGQKVAFARTPKVRNRTIAPLGFVVAPIIIVVWSLVTLVNDLINEHYLHAAFAGVNALLTAYVMVALYGLRAAIGDLAHDVRDRLYRPATRAPKADPAQDWVSVLYHGPTAAGETRETGAVAVALAALDQQERSSGGIIFQPHRGGPPGTSRAPAKARGDRPRLGSDERALVAEALADQLGRLQPGHSLMVRMDDDSSLQIGLSDLQRPNQPPPRGGADPVGVA